MESFWFFSLCASPAFIVKCRVFILGIVMHLYWGYTYRRNYSTVASILKLFQMFHIFHFLAHLVTSLCNHALSILCGCCWHWHLCTAVPVSALIIETSHLADICTYAPSLCRSNIKSMWHTFLDGSHFRKFLYVALLSTWLNIEPSYLAQLCINTGATHREEIMYLLIIYLKLWIFKEIHILHFLAYLAYMPKILSL